MRTKCEFTYIQFAPSTSQRASVSAHSWKSCSKKRLSERSALMMSRAFSNAELAWPSTIPRTIR